MIDFLLPQKIADEIDRCETPIDIDHVTRFCACVLAACDENEDSYEIQLVSDVLIIAIAIENTLEERRNR